MMMIMMMMMMITIIIIIIRHWPVITQWICPTSRTSRRMESTSSKTFLSSTRMIGRHHQHHHHHHHHHHNHYHHHQHHHQHHHPPSHLNHHHHQADRRAGPPAPLADRQQGIFLFFCFSFFRPSWNLTLTIYCEIKPFPGLCRSTLQSTDHLDEGNTGQVGHAGNIFEFTISENLTRLRRRWHRWYHAITAMNRMRKFSIDTRSSNTFDMFYIVQNIANNSKVFGVNNFWKFIKLPGRDLVFRSHFCISHKLPLQMTVVGATRNLCVGPEAGRYPQEEVACLILPTQLNHLFGILWIFGWMLNECFSW